MAVSLPHLLLLFFSIFCVLSLGRFCYASSLCPRVDKLAMLESTVRSQCPSWIERSPVLEVLTICHLRGFHCLFTLAFEGFAENQPSLPSFLPIFSLLWFGVSCIWVLDSFRCYSWRLLSMVPISPSSAHSPFFDFFFCDFGISGSSAVTGMSPRRFWRLYPKKIDSSDH